MKTNPLPDAERLLWRLRDRVHPYTDDLEHRDRYVLIKGTEALGQAFLGQAPDKAVDGLVEELKKDLLRIRKGVLAGAFAVKDYPGGVYAEATVAAGPPDLLGIKAVDLWAGFPDRKLVARVLRKAREANSQVPKGRQSIVAINIGSLTNLAMLQSEILFEARSRPADFDSTCSVVAFATRSTLTKLREEIIFAFQTTTPRLAPLQWRVLEALLGRPANQPPGIDFAFPPPSGPAPYSRGAVLTKGPKTG